MSNRIKELRKKNKYTQDEIAKVIGVSRQALAFYENGERTMTYDTIKILSSFFKVTPDYLMGATDNPQTQLPIESVKLDKPVFTLDFNVIITGDIEEDAKQEIENFVAYIKSKYGYPKQAIGLAGLLKQRKQ